MTIQIATPEEDEIFNRMDLAREENEHLLRAVREAQHFVDSRSASELSIMTLRKAFEMGYRFGWADGVDAGVKRGKAAPAVVPGKPVAYRIKMYGQYHYFDHSDPFPHTDGEPLFAAQDSALLQDPVQGQTK